jgi:hypothetical protein
MEVGYVLVIIQTRSFDAEKTLGIYKFKHSKTAWAHYDRDKKELPPGTFIALMTIDNFQKRMMGKKNALILEYVEPPKQPRKAPQARRAIDAIAAGDIPGIERRKNNGKD